MKVTTAPATFAISRCQCIKGLIENKFTLLNRETSEINHE